jgi:hypothetical protein
VRARDLIPAAAKRRHERWSTRRYLRARGALNARYAERHGLEVRRGPCAGLRYLPELVDGTGDLVAKLVGAYERELHPVLGGWVRRRPAHFVDVGAAEGFYAVGFALAAPGTTVHAYDIDPEARARCARMAALNGVADRVRVEARCTTGTLAGFPERGVVLLVDAEGYERELLDPVAAPRLLGWEVLVELHAFIDPAIPGLIAGRFAASHDVVLIDGESRDDVLLPELANLAPRRRALLLDERRPGPMQWAWLRPRAAAA